MSTPEGLRYSPEHCWARQEGASVRVGLTDFAQAALGDVVFVSLPDVGASIEADGVLGEVESTKAVSEVYAPVAGTVVAVNDDLVEHPATLNSDPYGAGWFCVVEMSDATALDGLLDAAGYVALIAQ